MANVLRGEQRRAWFELADGRLLCLGALLRSAFDLKLLGRRQIKDSSESLEEPGRLLGTWLKGTDR